MSHNLATINGRTAMMYSADRGKPWHGLGQSIQGAATWRQALQMAQLDWTVSTRPLYDAAGVRVGAWGTFRDSDNHFLGTVGSGYAPIQNTDAFLCCDALMEAENGAHYESAGALGDGKRIFCLARVPYDFSVNGYTQDKHETYLLFETSHDGSRAATARLTTVRVVCQNTLNMALSGRSDGVLRIKHTASGTERLAAARSLLSGAAQTTTTIRAKLEELARRRVDKTIARAAMAKLFGEDWTDSERKKNQVSEIARLFESNDNNAIPEIRGTAYNLLNACTEWSDHYRSVRQTESKGGMSVQTIRNQNALFEYDSWKAKAIDAIMTTTETAARKSHESISVPVSSKIGNILEQVAI